MGSFWTGGRGAARWPDAEHSPLLQGGTSRHSSEVVNTKPRGWGGARALLKSARVLRAGCTGLAGQMVPLVPVGSHHKDAKHGHPSLSVMSPMPSCPAAPVPWPARPLPLLCCGCATQRDLAVTQWHTQHTERRGSGTRAHYHRFNPLVPSTAGAHRSPFRHAGQQVGHIHTPTAAFRPMRACHGG